MYDVVFIGSGHASWHGALALAQAGKKVAIVEEELTGGTCTNYGCDAKIALDGPFEYFSGLENYKGVCVDEMPKINWTRLMAYKKWKPITCFSGWSRCSPRLVLTSSGGTARLPTPTPFASEKNTWKQNIS